MPWKELPVDRLRMEFVMQAREPRSNMSALSREYGISRKTGYKWLNRYEAEGIRGLADRPRTPHSNPLAISVETTLLVLRLRLEHRYWGPRKLRATLLREGHSAPSTATLARVLRKAGMIGARPGARPRRWEPQKPSIKADGPNALWTVDFKGWWRTQDGKRVETLSVRDAWSRYLLCLEPLAKTDTKHVQAAFAQLFARFGLPDAIRSDNGPPFASITAPHGLTRLSAWWRCHGIPLERIEPGHPEQNGAHERMHADVAREIERTPSATWSEEKRRLERWRRDFNTRRPHEALDMRVPGELYQRSARRFQSDLADWPHPDHFEQRQVGLKGGIKLAGRDRFISESLKGRRVGLEATEVDTWRVWFCDLLLGQLDQKSGSPLRHAAPPKGQEERKLLPMS